MAPVQEGRKRINKRKSRTAEVSSASSSSESENESVASSVAPAPQSTKQKQTKPETKKVSNADSSDAEDAVRNTTVSLPGLKVTRDSNKAFEEFYRRQAAQEFAEDLFKLQSAGDFSAKSVPILIAALQQGTTCFSAEEKERVVGGVEG